MKLHPWSATYKKCSVPGWLLLGPHDSYYDVTLLLQTAQTKTRKIAVGVCPRRSLRCASLLPVVHLFDQARATSVFPSTSYGRKSVRNSEACCATERKSDAEASPNVLPCHSTKNDIAFKS